MLNLTFRNGNTPALNARNLNAIVEAINTMQTQLANPFTFKGSVSTVANLPSSGNTVNDTYYVTAETCLYTWDGDSWEVSSLSESDYLTILNHVLDNIANAYDSTKTYSVGDYCIYNGVFYRCETAIITAENWNPNHWESVNIGDILTGISAAVSALGSSVDWNSSRLSEIEGAAIQYRGVLNTTTATPDTVEDVGYWTVSAAVASEILNKTVTGGVFFNFIYSSGVFMQMFILLDGQIYARYKNQGDFKSFYNDTLGSLSLESGGLTPDNVPAKYGYYISPSSVTQEYTGVYQQATFLVFVTPAGNISNQVFILPNGMLFSRYGATGDFANAVDDTFTKSGYAADSLAVGNAFNKTVRLLGNLSLDEGGVTPDTAPATPGYYLSNTLVTREFTGASARAVFYVFTSPNGVIYLQSFVLENGTVFSRYGNSGSFSENVPFGVLGYLSLDEGGLTPDNVPAKSGYYISPSAVTQEYTGFSQQAVFSVFVTPSGNISNQVFILPNGMVFSRYGTYGDFNDFVGKQVSNQTVYYSSSSTATTNATDSTGGLVNVYIPYGNGKHFRASFIHGTRPEWQEGESTNYKSEDVYRFDSGHVGEISGTTYTEEFQLITSGAWDGATYTAYNQTTLAPSGTAFGTFHGWEKFTKCLIQVDGTTIANLSAGSTLPNTNITPCKNIDIFYWADIYSPGTSTVIAKTYKRYTVNADGIHCYTRYKWLTSGTRAMYVAMGCVSRALTNRAICDYDCELYDISNENVTPITTIANNKPNITRCVEFGLNNSAKCEINTDEPLYMYIQNSIDGATYNKIYFNNHGTVSNGDIWKFKFVFKFGGGTSV